MGRLALRIVEVSGHGDHGPGDLLTQRLASILDKLLQDHRGDLLRRVLLALNEKAHAAVIAADDLVRRALGLLLDLVPGAAHIALDLKEGALGV